MLITGDIHINTAEDEKFEFDRLIEYGRLLKKTAKLKGTSSIVLAGDIFDLANPSLKDIKAYFAFLNTLKTLSVHLIAGNHEALTKAHNINDTIFDYLPLPNNVTYYKEPTDVVIDGVDVRLIGHNALASDKTLEKGNVLITHFRSGVKWVSDELDVEVLSRAYKYVIAGDIHSHYKPKANIEYTSQPYSTHYKLDLATTGFISYSESGCEYIPTTLPNKLKVRYIEGITPTSFSDFIAGLDLQGNKYKVEVIAQAGDFADDFKDIATRAKGSANLSLKFDTRVVDEDAKDIVSEIVSNQSGKLDGVITTLLQQYFGDAESEEGKFAINVLNDLGVDTNITTGENNEK